MGWLNERIQWDMHLKSSPLPSFSSPSPSTSSSFFFMVLIRKRAEIQIQVFCLFILLFCEIAEFNLSYWIPSMYLEVPLGNCILCPLFLFSDINQPIALYFLCSFHNTPTVSIEVLNRSFELVDEVNFETCKIGGLYNILFLLRYIMANMPYLVLMSLSSHMVLYLSY